MNCAIWDTQAQVLESRGGDFESYDSPRAGGKYWISGSAASTLGTFSNLAKKLLTTWLCEQRRSGVEIPRIDTKILSLVKSRQSMPFNTKLSSALRCVGSSIKTLGEYAYFRDNNPALAERFLAETESENATEINELLRLLRETGYLEVSSHSAGANARPTASGWEELDRLRLVQKETSQAFVAMWFNEKTDDAYINGIAPALLQTGYKPMRIDKKDHNNKIDDEIVAEIRRSRFLIADFTCEPKSVRGGVYFEAGFAMGLGIPVIWTCNKSAIDDLHFDTRQYAHIVWQEPPDLFAQLRNRIGATLGIGPEPITDR